MKATPGGIGSSGECDADSDSSECRSGRRDGAVEWRRPRCGPGLWRARGTGRTRGRNVKALDALRKRSGAPEGTGWSVRLTSLTQARSSEPPYAEARWGRIDVGVKRGRGCAAISNRTCSSPSSTTPRACRLPLACSIRIRPPVEPHDRGGGDEPQLRVGRVQCPAPTPGDVVSRRTRERAGK